MQRLVTTSPVDETSAIDALRSHLTGASTPQNVTVKHVTTVVNSITRGEPYTKLASKLSAELSVNPAFVADIIAVLGTWLAHSLGKSDTVYPYSEVCKPDETDGKRIPPGYAPTDDNKRDLAKALSAIMYHTPDKDTVERFVSRTYTDHKRQMTYSVVSGVWGLCRAKRINSVRLISADLVFLSQVVEAFDLLDIARADAVKAVRSLTRESEAGHVLKQCDKAYWLDERNFNKLRAAAELDAVNEAGKQRFNYELANFVTRIQCNPAKYGPTKVSDLTLPQVRKICLLAGIPLESVNKAEETQIRKALKDIGLESDMDRLVPQALLCASKGTLDDFWEIMKSRVNGNGAWLADLSELLES